MSAVYPALPGVTSNLARPQHKLLDQVRDVLRVKHYAYRAGLRSLSQTVYSISRQNVSFQVHQEGVSCVT